jgi:hypothetical protein
MSYSKNQNKKTNLFCKVCFNKGDTKLSRTHNTCDEKGNNCCPTLAAFKCTYCDANGHKVKFCIKKTRDQEREVREEFRLKTSLQRYKERRDREAASMNTNEKENKGTACAKVGAFAALLDESDDEDDSEQKQVVRAAFVQHWEPPKRKVKAYASVAAGASIEKTESDNEQEKMSTARLALMGLWKPSKSRCWADEEDEDEYHDYVDARKRWGCEEMDKVDRQRLSYKDAASKK